MISTATWISKYPKANNAAYQPDQPAKNSTNNGSDKEAGKDRAPDPDPSDFRPKKQNGDESKDCPQDAKHKTAKNDPGDNSFDESLCYCLPYLDGDFFHFHLRSL
jgi:hypothetical protein